MGNARELRIVRNVGAVVVMTFGLLACSKTDLSNGIASGASTTTISGKVTLPVALASKPGYKAEMYAKTTRGKPGSPDFKPSSKPVAGEASTALPAQAATLVNAPVELYDASHPEWIYPIAVAQTDASGSYTLTVLANAAENGGAYVNGEPIPAGYYTLLSKKTDPVTNELQVAIQTVVKGFAGAISGTDLVAQPSDAMPKILSIQGVRKNTDGTETWGRKSVTNGDGSITAGAPQVAGNSAIQVVFSMAMYRQSVLNEGLSLACSNGVVAGKWTITADWTTATFYPANPLPVGDCTVTVKGSDTSATPVRNVYENARTTTAYGYFTVLPALDTVSPTGVILSPVAEDASVISPIRFASNELLDINAVTLFSNPSFGDRPRVVYLGELANSASQYKYVYEAIPSRALKLNTDYDIVLAGAKDLAGNHMSVLNYSFGTIDTVSGVSSTEPAVQEIQLEALTTFGKWVRALNEHNIGTMQSLMSGDFVYEYDSIAQGNKESDTNRDGRLSLNEFSGMLEEAFRQWEYCSTTMNGSIVDVINVDLVNGKVDFAFTLSGSSVLTSQECRDTAPKDKLYLTLKQQNAAWVIVRASEGIDTRDKPLVIYDYIPTVSPANGTVLTANPSETSPLAFSWNDSISMVENQPAKVISSYVFVIWDSRNQWNGRAYVIDPAKFKPLFPINGKFELEYPFTALPDGVTDISAKFGFDSFSWDNWNPGDNYWLNFVSGPGEELEWAVLGLGTKKQSDDFSAISSSDLLRDIVASSNTASYRNEGIRPHIAVDVLANGSQIRFSEFIWGYDVGSSDKVTLQLTSTNADPVWDVYVSGRSGYDTYPTSAVINGEVEIQLYQGLNYVWLTDGHGLYHWFTIATTGGTPPKVLIYTVMTDNGYYLSPDAWGYISALGAKKISIIGKVTDGSTDIYLNLWNNLGANEYRRIPVGSGGIFVTDAYYENPDDTNSAQLNDALKIYKGDNWISLSSSSWNYNEVGVFTDTGSLYIPPITVKIPDAVQTEDRGNSTYWDASADSNSRIKITGIMSNAKKGAITPSYSVYSDAGYQSADMSVNAATGEYTLYIDLYHGWNYLYIYDGVGGYAYVNIFTSNGKVVVPFEIRSVNGIVPPYQGAQMTVSGCSAVVKGIAEPGSWLNANWYGYTDSYYSENPPLQAGWVPTVDTNGDGIQDAVEFTVTVPVLSDTGYGAYTYLDIYNSMWRWTGVSLNTTAANCGYIAPSNTVEAIVGATSGGPVTLNYPDYYLDFGNDVTSLRAQGTHTRTDHTISATLRDNCGVEHAQSTAAVSGAWNFANIPLYQNYNELVISDGYSSKWYYTYSDTSSLVAQAAVNTVLVAPTGLTPTDVYCSSKQYDLNSLGAAVTKVTVQATTLDGLSGPGTLYTNQRTIPLNFVNGVATAEVDVYEGYNYLDISDPAWRWSSLYITTSNGIAQPKAIEITSHAQGDTVPSGNVTIGGVWDKAWYSPDYLYASVYECDASWQCISQSFSNDGYSTPFDTIDTATGTFSFTANFGGIANPAYTEVYVYGSSSDNYEGHAHTIYVNANPNGYTEWWYKPSIGETSPDITKTRGAKAMQQERLKRMLQSQKAAQVKALARPKR